MATDLTVILEDRPGTMAEMGEVLGAAGVNIDGSCGFPCQGVGIAHILVEDPAKAKATLEAAGFEVRDPRPVLLLDVKDRPGEGGRIGRQLADAGVNVDLVYISMSGQLVIGVDDLAKAQSAL
jgi:hypothetical protein